MLGEFSQQSWDKLLLNRPGNAGGVQPTVLGQAAPQQAWECWGSSANRPGNAGGVQ